MAGNHNNTCHFIHWRCQYLSGQTNIHQLEPPLKKREQALSVAKHSILLHIVFSSSEYPINLGTSRAGGRFEDTNLVVVNKNRIF